MGVIDETLFHMIVLLLNTFQELVSSFPFLCFGLLHSAGVSLVVIQVALHRMDVIHKTLFHMIVIVLVSVFQKILVFSFPFPCLGFLHSAGVSLVVIQVALHGMDVIHWTLFHMIVLLLSVFQELVSSFLSRYFGVLHSDGFSLVVIQVVLRRMDVIHKTLFHMIAVVSLNVFQKILVFSFPFPCLGFLHLTGFSLVVIQLALHGKGVMLVQLLSAFQELVSSFPSLCFGVLHLTGFYLVVIQVVPHHMDVIHKTLFHTIVVVLLNVFQTILVFSFPFPCLGFPRSAGFSLVVIQVAPHHMDVIHKTLFHLIAVVLVSIFQRILVSSFRFCCLGVLHLAWFSLMVVIQAAPYHVNVIHRTLFHTLVDQVFVQGVVSPVLSVLKLDEVRMSQIHPGLHHEVGFHKDVQQP